MIPDFFFDPVACERMVEPIDEELHDDEAGLEGPPSDNLSIVYPERIGGLSVWRGSTVGSRSIEWLWPGRIALRKLHAVCGNFGAGKSYFAIDLAARVTTGALWPDSSGRARVGDVAFVLGDDEMTDTVCPRLVEHGADLSRVHFACVQSLRDHVDQAGQSCLRARRWSVRNFDAWDRLLQERPEIRALIIDSVNEVLPMGRALREACDRLAALANRRNVAVIGLLHPPSPARGWSLRRRMQALPFVAKSRVAWGLIEDWNDSDRTLLACAKNSLGSPGGALAFRVVNGKVEWEAKRLKTEADDSLDRLSRSDKSRLGEAIDWLRELLAAGPQEARKVERLAQAAGIRTITCWRARNELGVVSKRQSSEAGVGWQLALPDSK